MPEAPSSLVIAAFDKEIHDRREFSCGHPGIDNFLRQSLSAAEKSDHVRSYMATQAGDPSVLGFYTLQAHAIAGDRTGRSRPQTLPAIYLKAVAVDRSVQGRGVGTALMVDALRRCAAHAQAVGIAVVVLDVLHDAAHARRKAFYETLGFTSLDDPENPYRMYIRMKDIRRTLG